MRSTTKAVVRPAARTTARALMVALDILAPPAAADQVIAQGAVYVFRDGTLAKHS